MLNKSDLFKNKLETIGLRTSFPDCDSSKENDFDYSSKYIGKYFCDIVRNAKVGQEFCSFLS